MSSYHYSIFARAGCFVCHGDIAHWISKNAHGVAARHAKATGHHVWVDVYTSVIYNKPAEGKKQ